MLSGSIKIVLWLILAILLLTIANMIPPFMLNSKAPYLIYILLGILLISGSVLLYLTLKTGFRGKLKSFLLLTGASAAGIPVFAVLHNLVYGLMSHFLGKSIGDEPVFFILAIIICPIGLVVGLLETVIQSRRVTSRV